MDWTVNIPIIDPTMPIVTDGSIDLTFRCPLRKKLKVDIRVPRALCTLLISSAVIGGNPHQSNADKVSSPPEPAIEERR